ncbi:hypothetical protein ATE47_03445 [Chryseobacterium sp. IHB B 17019]|uniref:hypothetical protein n=1 Tax=Chryseobacterium sp. IHB B 17019 TaxID=1721091 RepID=UPI000722677D|nr:hypothetical protein [Chryseobacterium sp. IHB B 17019]ALR29638.1 hypothetical protein ATE47_03445 [Chryseobacterium sp. IHB B 17019]
MICLTQNNTEKPWILFEAGALSSSLDKSRVCPILFGVKKSQITGPLSGIQLTEFTKSSFFQLIQAINKFSEDKIIEDKILKKSFDAFFPDLEEKIREILESQDSTTTTATIPERSERNILEEILDLVRKQNQSQPAISGHTLLPPPRFGTGATGPVLIDNNEWNPGDLIFDQTHGVGRIVSINESNMGTMIKIRYNNGIEVGIDENSMKLSGIVKAYKQ